mmetsp:Transcript_17394/g.38345  ORF Transcript_17394/g.38345 Transcript_17394/m.38345 type:complete len:158 (-) Transcript_17394:58-531(-)
MKSLPVSTSLERPLAYFDAVPKERPRGTLVVGCLRPDMGDPKGSHGAVPGPLEGTLEPGAQSPRSSTSPDSPAMSVGHSPWGTEGEERERRPAGTPPRGSRNRAETFASGDGIGSAAQPLVKHRRSSRLMHVNRPPTWTTMHFPDAIEVMLTTKGRG